MSEKEAEKPAGKVILPFSRAWQTLEATRSLGRRGVEVITGDEYAMTPASFSRYSVAHFRYPSPTREPDAFLDKLEEVVLEHKPEDPETPYVLMPIHKETYLIARHRARFEPHIRVPIPTLEAIEQVHNKGTLAAFALEKNIPIPRTWLPDSVEQLAAQVNEITLPVFVKLRESAAGVGIKKVDTAEEMLETFSHFIERYRLKPRDYPLVQEAVPGDDYCVTTLFDSGQLRASMTYRNLRAFPAESGAGVVRETVEAPAMERIAGELLGSLGWHGVGQLDFRWDGKADSEPRLIEVNPRFWGGLSQAIESGWDYPWLLFRLAVDGHVDPPEKTRYDVRTETPILGFLATLQEAAENDKGMEALKEAWRGAKHEFREGSKRAGLRQLFSGLKHFAKGKDRSAALKRALEVHKDNVYDVLSKNDPLPALGIFYPLAVFLRHGKVNMELITGESGPEPAEDEENESNQ